MNNLAEAEKPAVYVVDDDQLVLTITKRVLTRAGFRVRATDDARTALCEVLAEPPFALVADLQMPELDGGTLLGLVRGLLPAVARILHTGEEPGTRAEQSQNAGEFRIVPKSGHNRALIDALLDARERPRASVAAPAQPSRLLAAQLSEALMPRVGKQRGAGTLLAERVRLLGGLVGLPVVQCDALALAAQLHDVAMAALPVEVFGARGPIPAELLPELHAHPVRAAAWLKKCRNLAPPEVLDAALRIVEEHHERVDGTGYPRGIAGEAVGKGARVLAVLDAYLAMQRERRYAPVRDREEARSEIARGAGTQFDAEVVRVFLGHTELH